MWVGRSELEGSIKPIGFRICGKVIAFGNVIARGGVGQTPGGPTGRGGPSK